MDAPRRIRCCDKHPQVKIIGLSEYAYGYNSDAMEKAGAVGIYLKSNALEELYPAIKKVTAVYPQFRSWIRPSLRN
jgi:DNA-binding NarL/FixJ family response regulator